MKIDLGSGQGVCAIIRKYRDDNLEGIWVTNPRNAAEVGRIVQSVATKEKKRFARDAEEFCGKAQPGNFFMFLGGEIEIVEMEE